MCCYAIIVFSLWRWKRYTCELYFRVCSRNWYLNWNWWYWVMLRPHAYWDSVKLFICRRRVRLEGRFAKSTKGREGVWFHVACITLQFLVLHHLAAMGLCLQVILTHAKPFWTRSCATTKSLMRGMLQPVAMSFGKMLAPLAALVAQRNNDVPITMYHGIVHANTHLRR